MKVTPNCKVEGNDVISYTTYVAKLNRTEKQIEVRPPYKWSATTSKQLTKLANMIGYSIVYVKYLVGEETYKTEQEALWAVDSLQAKGVTAEVTKVVSNKPLK
jgi:hypothetical protein